MNRSKPQPTYCQFTDLKNGVWQFTFTESSNRAVDEWYEWQSYLKTAIPPADDKRVRMLLDLRKSGTLPLLYSLQQGRDWRKKYPDINTFHVQIAMLLNPFPRYQQPYVRLIKDGVNIFTMSQVEVELFFADGQEAINWLLEA